jgi:hypothetical protein
MHSRSPASGSSTRLVVSGRMRSGALSMAGPVGAGANSRYPANDRVHSPALRQGPQRSWLRNPQQQWLQWPNSATKNQCSIGWSTMHEAVAEPGAVMYVCFTRSPPPTSSSALAGETSASPLSKRSQVAAGSPAGKAGAGMGAAHVGGLGHASSTALAAAGKAPPQGAGKQHDAAVARLDLALSRTSGRHTRSPTSAERAAVQHAERQVTLAKSRAESEAARERLEELRAEFEEAGARFTTAPERRTPSAVSAQCVSTASGRSAVHCDVEEGVGKKASLIAVLAATFGSLAMDSVKPLVSRAQAVNAAAEAPASLMRPLAALICDAASPFVPLAKAIGPAGAGAAPYAVSMARYAVDPIAQLPGIKRDVSKARWDPLSSLASIQAPSHATQGHVRWDPVSNLPNIAAPSATLVWDPATHLSSISAPTGRDDWDPISHLTAIASPSGVDAWDPIHAMTASLPPTAYSMFDPVHALTQVAAPKSVSGWDPVQVLHPHGH